MAAPPSGRTTDRRTWVLLWLVVLAGLALRVWFGSWGLGYSRFWDERYSLKNVRAIFLTGDFEPANTYYPSPVFNLPQAAVLRASDAIYTRTHDQAYQVLTRKRTFTATGILLCRMVQAVYGAAAIAFVFLAGRAMFSTRVGLLAAVFVAFSPWPLHASGYVKPDALLLMTIALSFYASLAAVERPTIGRHAAAGVAIALAMSSKLTGGMIALCLVVATLARGWRDRRRWWLLAVAGASSAVAFVAFNPYWQSYLRYLEGLKRDYLLRAELHDSTRADMPRQLFDFVTGDYLHGLLLGGLSLAGMVWLAARAVRRGDSPLERAKLAMLVVFPLAYTIVYAIQTSYFKANNFLPLVIFTSIAAAWVLVSGFEWAGRRWPALRRPAVAAAAFLLLAGWQASRGWVYAYRSYTPTTRDAAFRFLDDRLRPGRARLIHVESWDEPDPRWGMARGYGGGERPAVRKPVDRLGEVSLSELELSDGLLFFERRLAGDDAAFYRDLIAGVPDHRVRRVAAEPFVRRGPAFVAVALAPEHVEPIFDLEPRPCPRTRASGGCLEMDLPAIDPGPDEAFNLYLFLPLAPDGTLPEVEVGESAVEILRASRQRGGNLYVTPRFRLDGSLTKVRLRRPAAFGEEEMKIQLFRWSMAG